MSITGFRRMDNGYADGFIAGYAAGVLAQKQAADRVERTRITAAIRRAARIARWHDGTYVDSVDTCMVGDCVREAIRAAIGSPKT